MPIVLAIDPASHQAGVALFVDDKIYTCCLNGTGSWSQRILQQRQKLIVFLTWYLPAGQIVDHLVVEEIGRFGGSKLSYSVGALCALESIDSDLNTIGVRTWKSMAKRYGCKDKDPKGRKALLTVKPDWENLNITDDEADAVLIGLAYLEKGFIDD